MVVKSQDGPVSLPSGEVHLWFLTDSPQSAGPVCAEGFAHLSSPEKKRFCKMKNRSVARRFLLSRILMRRVLARYLDQTPMALRFCYNANGKPELDAPSVDGLNFNLSHSGSGMVLAVTRAPSIGIDIESMDRAPSAHSISQQFFWKSVV